MTAVTQDRTDSSGDRSPHRTPYDLDMAKRELMGIQELRIHLKTVLEKVSGTATTPGGTHIVFTRHGKPTAVLVPMDWYRDAAEKVGEPTDL